MRHGRRDSNHAEIRDGLRAVFGRWSCQDTADLGNGFPDLVFGTQGITFMFEVKAGSRAKLRPEQAMLLSRWFGGPWCRVDSLQDAFEVINYELGARGLPQLEIEVVSRGDRD